MKHLTDNPYAERLTRAMKRHLERQDREGEIISYRCHHCRDSLFIQARSGGYYPCSDRACQAWQATRDECDRIAASKQRGRKRDRGKDPF